MADFTDKAQEAVGRAKEAAGDLTGDDELKADGAADTAEAKVKQGVDAVAEKADDVKQAVGEAVDGAKQQLSGLADDTTDAARQLHLDEAASTLGDTRVIVGAVAAAVLLAVVVRRRRASNGRRAAVKRVAKTGIGRALTRC
ncbi:CsbD family protein [Mycolicibacterium hodleri]|uniref:CsbD family protein n=1 Tax=Mycolicibacterium hodleri TaxID=49897 RepID=UPI0027E2B64A|nr:CsbD family protein [Mycolicibacterium hodleri]